MEYSYDLYDRTAREVYRSKTGAVQADYRYVYNANGELARQYAVSGETYQFAYDSLGRLIRSMQTDASGAVVQRTEHLYDTANRLTKQSWTVGDSTFTEHYAYRAGDGSLQSVTTDGLGSVTLSYDSVKRLSEQLFTTSENAKLVKRYVYSDNASTQKGSTRPLKVNYYLGEGETETLLSGNTYVYTADGNISRMWNAQTGKLVAEYAYDALGRLTQEKRYDANGTLTENCNYYYDLAGNLDYTDCNNALASEYRYENASWPDLLTDYNGTAIAYEGQSYNAASNRVTGTAQSGNPINWYNGTTYTGLTWQQGRRLTSLYAGNTYITYAYDMNGVRSRKTVGGVAHDYVTQNGRVIQERYGTTVLQFVYGTDGNPYAMRYSQDSGSTWQTFYYILNLQGDVVKLVDASGTVCAEYSYDAWGKCLSQTTAASCAVANLADRNPIRYRGYYYDTETGWYYLQSRYYDPIVKRFINADIPEALTEGFENFAQYNMFLYCFNNPISMSDDTGTWPKWATKLAVGIGAIVVGAAVVAATVATGGAAAAFTSALVTGVKAAAVSGVVAAGTSATVTAVVSVASGDDVHTTLKRTASAAVDGFADGFMWGGISMGASHVAGYITSKTGIFQRDVIYGKNNFMYGTNELTIWRHGSNFRIDASATRGLHYHLRTATTGIGKHRTEWISGIIGGVSGIFSALEK